MVAVGKQMIVSPIFLGAEPNVSKQNMTRCNYGDILIPPQVIDDGLDAGISILDSAGSLPLTLMQSLPRELQETARIYKDLHDHAMPDGRWNPADQVSY